MNAITHLLQKNRSDGSAYDKVWNSAEQSVSRLLNVIKASLAIRDHFQNAFYCLERLPLSTEEFANAKKRLHNALEYCESRERGAAVFEINLLYRSLFG